MVRVNWVAVCLSALIAFGVPATHANADADPFVGTAEFDWYEDWNIQDGISIIESQFTGTATRLDAEHVTLSDGSHSLTLLQDVDILRLESPPLDTGSGLCLAAYMMSEGVNISHVRVGQEYSDPDDISVSVGLATRSTAVVTPSDLAGYWQLDEIEHTNVRNLADSPPEQFERHPWLWRFTDIGGNQLQGDRVGFGTIGVFELAGNRVSLVSAAPFGDFHLLEIVTDGNTLSFATIISEFDDATDVSVSIGLGQKVSVLGDANGDGKVDLSDLGILATNWGRTDVIGLESGDFNFSGGVDLSDLGILATNWGAGVAPVPEPASMALLSLGGLAMIRRKRTGR